MHVGSQNSQIDYCIEHPLTTAFKVGLLKKKIFIFFNESHLKLMKNAFYFILKAFFVLEIFKYLFWLFDHVEKTGLIRKIRLISKYIWRHNLANKHLQYKNHAENEAGWLVPDLFLCLRKALYEVKAHSFSLSFNIFR